MKVQDILSEMDTKGYGPGDSETWPKGKTSKRKSASPRETDDEYWDSIEREERKQAMWAKKRQDDFEQKFDSDVHSDGYYDHKGAQYSKWILIIDADDEDTARTVASRWERLDNLRSHVLTTDKSKKGSRKVRYEVHFINADPIESHPGRPEYKGQK